MKTRLVRTNRATTIHRRDCPQLHNPRIHPVDWKWAEDKSRAAIEASVHVRGLGLRLCKTCDPLDGWLGPFHACTFSDGCDCEGTCKAYKEHVEDECCRA
jgi:hypothetical protein